MFKKVFSLPALAESDSVLVLRRLTLVVLLTFLFSLLTLTLFARPVHAQACTPSAPGPQPAQEAINEFNKCAIEKNIFDDKIFNFNQISGTTDSLYTLLVGSSLLHPETDAITANSGAIAAEGKLVAILFASPPVSGVSYFAHKIQEFNPVQPTYAQTGGIGFAALSPVQDIWTVFRNASYVGFVIVFVIMGFMIMFRAHISPQAVATVQDSIPRIVVALILVTFSYAIAGLLIDVMFLTLNIIIRLLVEAKLLNPDKANLVFEKSILGVTIGAWKDIVSTVAHTVNELLKEVITSIAGLNKIIGFIGGGITGIIFGIAMLFIMFRVFLMLLMAYVMIIILTMVAPFFFLIQALPGNNGAKEWSKQMAANVAVFPTVAIMVIFAGILSGIGALGGTGGGLLPSEQVLKFPLLAGGLEADAIGKLIGLGFLLMTPEAANMIKKFVSGPGGGGGPSFGGAGAAALGASAGFLGRRAVQNPVGQAVSTMGKAAGDRTTNVLIGAAPSWMRGGKNIKKEDPTFSVK